MQNGILHNLLDTHLSGTIIRDTFKDPKFSAGNPISIKLQMPNGCD
jgi:hypothetical protein